MIIAIITIVCFILFFFSVPTACHISKVHQRSLSVFLQRWWNGFHQLTTCLDHNVASLWQRHLVYFFLCSHSVFPLDHTNPPRFDFQTPPPPFNFSIVVSFSCDFLFGIVSSLEFLFCWFGGSVHGECWILGVTGTDTGTLLGVLAVQCLLFAAHYAWSLCADRWNFFYVLQPLCVRGPFWMPSYTWRVFCKYVMVIMKPLLPV